MRSENLIKCFTDPLLINVQLLEKAIEFLSANKGYNVQESKQIGENYFEMGYTDYSEQVYWIQKAFPQYCGDYQVGIDEIRNKPIEELGANEIHQYITFIFRSDRLADGAIKSCLESGVLLALAKRAVEYVQGFKKYHLGLQEISRTGLRKGLDLNLKEDTIILQKEKMMVEKLKFFVNKIDKINSRMFVSNKKWKPSSAQKGVLKSLQDIVLAIYCNDFRKQDVVDGYWLVWDYFNDHENKNEEICLQEMNAICSLIKLLCDAYHLYEENKPVLFQIKYGSGAVLHYGHPNYNTSRTEFFAEMLAISDDKGENESWCECNFQGQAKTTKEGWFVKIIKNDVSFYFNKLEAISLAQEKKSYFKGKLDGAFEMLEIVFEGKKISIDILNAKRKDREICQKAMCGIIQNLKELKC